MADDTTPVRSEGELIDTYLAPLAAGVPGAFGLRDDCAVAAPRPGHEFVFKTDAIAAGVHFLESDAPEDIAWKALAVNVSDLAAKAATPVGYLLSLAFPEAPTHGWMRRFARGLEDAQVAFGLRLLGGDTDRRPGPLSITPLVFGEVPAGTMVRRGSAQPGDRIYLSGTIGDAALGLALVTGRASPWNAKLQAADVRHCEARYRRPVPRLGLRHALRDAAHAAMDLSDGLAKDLGRMCRASGCGARVVATRLPLSHPAAAAIAADPALFARIISAGDDYEVLAAVAPTAAESFERLAARAGIAVTDVGAFTSTPGVEIVEDDGRPVALTTPGYDHF